MDFQLPPGEEINIDGQTMLAAVHGNEVYLPPGILVSAGQRICVRGELSLILQADMSSTCTRIRIGKPMLRIS